MLLGVGKDYLPRKAGTDVPFYSIPKYAGGNAGTYSAIFDSPGYPIQVSAAVHERCRTVTHLISHLLAVFGRPALQWTDMSEMPRLSHGAMAWKSSSCPFALQLHPALVTRPY